MKQFFMSTFLISATSLSLHAQNIEITDYKFKKNTEFPFLGNWKIKQLKNNISFEIFGDRIVNNTKSTSNELIIEAYFVPSNSKVSINELPNRLKRSIKIGRIEGNNTTLRNIKINFDKNYLSNLDNGIYEVVLVLEDSKTKTIKNYHILDTPLKIDEKDIQLVQNQQVKQEQVNIITEAEIQPEVITVVNQKYNSPKNFYDIVPSSINIPEDDTEIQLTGNWKLEINHEESNVIISGYENNITNRSDNKTNNLRLLIYLASESPELNTTVKGFEFLHVDLGNFKPNQSIYNAKISTNITRIIPRGIYYPIIVLLEEDINGGYLEKYVIKNLNKIES